MAVSATEISSIIKGQIAGFQDQATITNVGQVVEVGDGIARAYGLSQVMAGELVEFTNTGTLGMALNLGDEQRIPIFSRLRTLALRHGAAAQLAIGELARADHRLERSGLQQLAAEEGGIPTCQIVGR